MAKAKITGPDGLTITIDGTPKEISSVVEELRGKVTKPPIAGKRSRERSGPVLLVDLIGALRDGGFFRKPKDLASIKSKLAEMGHHYPVTTLSPIMLRQVRHRNLRRIKEKGRWMYTFAGGGE